MQISFEGIYTPSFILKLQNALVMLFAIVLDRISFTTDRSMLSWWQDVDNALVTRPMPFSMAMTMVFEEHLLIYEVASESDGCEAETGE